ncbi:MAG TPA: hypothetical protein VFB32_02095, partial [Rudaea sp.]|nr:hypothetical protein [Rudaea sp.]
MRLKLWLLALMLCVPLARGAHAQVTNGNFETGNLNGWTLGGQNHAAAVKSTNFSTAVNPPNGGTWFAALSTGPGSLSNTTYNVDGNGVNDYDMTSMQQTVTFTATTSPAMLIFDWNFASSEEDQPDAYDDVFDVQTTVGATTTKVLTGSACKLDGGTGSPYPAAPCTPFATAVNWTITGAAPITNTSLRFGVGNWHHACVDIPGTVVGNNTVTITFRVADQNDNQYDSALLLDNVSVANTCDVASSTLAQVTNSSGSNVQVKNGGIQFTPVDNGPALSTDNTGTAFAFASTGNYTADNPNALQQVFVYDASYSRVTGLTIAAGGSVQGVSLSGTTVGALHGRYVAIAATLNSAASQQIYRWDRQTSTLTQVTNTTGCANKNPSISSDGNRIAWETTCSAYTGQGTTQKIVYSTFTTSWSAPVNFMSAGTPAATCQGFEPHLSRGDTGNFIALRSTCGGLSGAAPVATNGDIFRYAISPVGWKRMTTATSASTNNYSPSIDAATAGNAGRYIYFISDGDYSNVNANEPEIYRYDVSSSTLALVTQSPSNSGYVSVHQAADGTGALFSYEYVNGTDGDFEDGTGNFNGTSVTLKLGASMTASLGADVGVDAGNVPT